MKLVLVVLLVVCSAALRSPTFTPPVLRFRTEPVSQTSSPVPDRRHPALQRVSPCWAHHSNSWQWDRLKMNIIGRNGFVFGWVRARERHWIHMDWLDLRYCENISWPFQCFRFQDHLHTEHSTRSGSKYGCPGTHCPKSRPLAKETKLTETDTCAICIDPNSCWHITFTISYHHASKAPGWGRSPGRFQHSTAGWRSAPGFGRRRLEQTSKTLQWIPDPYHCFKGRGSKILPPFLS